MSGLRECHLCGRPLAPRKVKYCSKDCKHRAAQLRRTGRPDREPGYHVRVYRATRGPECDAVLADLRRIRAELYGHIRNAARAKGRRDELEALACAHYHLAEGIRERAERVRDRMEKS